MQRKLLTIVVILSVFAGINANPAVQVHFNRVIDSNECLKTCMTPVRESNIELSIFKRANYSDYLLNLDQICSIITDARRCIDGCGVSSNPFALISMNSVCSKKTRADAKLLTPCLQSAGAQVHEQCVQTCSDYESLNDQIHMDTSTLKPEDQSAIDSLNSKTNMACSVLKCSARCSIDNFNKQCGQLENGVMAGELIREIVERILATHRMDLQVFGLLETVKKTTQPECSYLHTAGVLFNPIKDMIAQRSFQQEEKRTDSAVAPNVDPEQQIKLTANRLYVKIMKKQLQVLDKQLELLNRQEQKLDNELPRFMQNPPQHQFENESF